jgi:hypothetical protein
MESNGLQQAFFATLKNILPSHISIVDEIAVLLDLGYDSVYRRIRGEKPLTIDELKKLCDHFHISLDQVLQIKSDAIVFNTTEMIQEIRDLELYLKQVLGQLQHFQQFSQRKMHYLCKDFPYPQYFLIPGLSSFKCFFWMRDILGDERMKHLKYSIDNFPYPEIMALSEQISKAYNKIDSIDIMNMECVNSTLGQIEYYKEAGIFASEDDYHKTCDNVELMVNHIQHMAERGKKFLPGESELVQNGTYQLFINEVILGNNTILAQLDGKIVSFIPHSVFKFMTTRDPRFGEYLLRHFTNLMNRSTLISGSGEKERSKFFNKLRQKVKNLKLNHSTAD